MKAYKVNVVIGASRQLVIDLPAGLAEGPAEVIVLTNGDGADDDVAPSHAAHDVAVRAHLDRLASRHRPARSQADIDEQIARERQAWD